MKTFSKTAVAVAAVTVLTACGGGGSSKDAEPADPRNIELRFKAVAGGQAIGCGAPIAALGNEAMQAGLKDLRFYVSEVKLKRADGTLVPLEMPVTDWQHAGQVALIDLEDGTGSCEGRGTTGVNAAVTGTVPAGDYNGVVMTIGVPGSLNHTDTAAEKAPLDIQAMAWSWQAGRKFVKIEIAPVGGVNRPENPATNPPTPATSGPIFNIHLGSTGCTGNPASGEIVSCLSPNRLDLSFDSFNPDTQQIVLDVQQLFLGSNVAADLGGAFGCMSGKSDPECPAVFEALGISLDTGLTLDSGRNQKVFAVGAR